MEIQIIFKLPFVEKNYAVQTWLSITEKKRNRLSFFLGSQLCTKKLYKCRKIIQVWFVKFVEYDFITFSPILCSILIKMNFNQISGSANLSTTDLCHHHARSMVCTFSEKIVVFWSQMLHKVMYIFIRKISK